MPLRQPRFPLPAPVLATGAGLARITIMTGRGGVNDASAAVSVHGDGDARALQRVYCLARKAIDERIAIDEEIERRLAVIVLFTVSAQTADCADLPNEDAIVASCIDRLMAQTAPDGLVADTL